MSHILEMSYNKLEYRWKMVDMIVIFDTFENSGFWKYQIIQTIIIMCLDTWGFHTVLSHNIFQFHLMWYLNLTIAIHKQ